MTSDHYDAFAVLGVGVLLLGFIELRLRSLFARHEVREERLHASAQLVAEGAAARVLDNIRQIEGLRVETSAIRLDLANLSELVRVHETRLSDAELRILRAAVAVPRAIREDS